MKEKLKEVFEKVFNIQSNNDHIQSFIMQNKIYMLLSVTGFYVLSRLLTIISTLLNHSKLSYEHFLLTIGFHTIFLLILLSHFLFIHFKMEKLVTFLILFSIFSSVIFNLLSPPEDPIIAFFSLFIQMIFAQVILYVIFHDTKIIFIIYLITSIVIISYYFINLQISSYNKENFSDFLFTAVLYGLTMIMILLYLIHIEYQRAIRFIQKLLYIDYKTGLYNEKKLTNDILEKYNLNQKSTVIAIDFTDLLSLNRQFGFDEIQKNLMVKINQVKNCIRKKSKLYKLEGPLFVFTFKNEVDNLEAFELINTIHRILQSTFNINDNIIKFNYNLLGTLYPDDSYDVKTIIKNIQTLKYSYKKHSKNQDQIFWYDKSIHDLNERSLTLEKDIFAAVNEEQIQIVIQPKVELKTNSVMGGEVLARWNHQKYGWISPMEFIPIIEQEGLMDAFTDLVLKHTSSVIERLKKETGKKLELAVNISPSSLISGYVNETLVNGRESLPLTYLNGLELELTESLLFEMNRRSIHYISELKNMGYKISIDDFGTGFSNFEYLQQLEIDILKIDKRFIDRLMKSEKAELIVDAIIKMAHTLGIKVVAEGVETEDQVEKLSELSCDYIQGYYYSKPLEIEAFFEFIK